MRGVLLLSDGIDSPVAGILMRQNRMGLTCLHMINAETVPTKIESLKNLIDPKAGLFTDDHRPVQALIAARCNPRYQCLLCKRAMYRSAERLARKIDASYLVTGENLGQVASQTLENMFVLDSAVTLPVLRPLLGFDKQEIIDIARKMGTYEVSVQNAAECPWLPRQPLTMARLDAVLRQEKMLNHGQA